MSLLRTIVWRACSQYANLVTPRTAGVLGNSVSEKYCSSGGSSRGGGFQFDQFSKKEKKEFAKKSMEVDEMGQDASLPQTLKLSLEKAVKANDLRPGYGRVPTADVYEQTFGGVRYDELPTVYIKCTRNNTLAYATRGKKGEFVITNKSGGSVGFKNARKSTNVAAQSVGQQIGQALVKRNMTDVRVVFDGTGIHRLTALRGLTMTGVNIVSIQDRLYPSFNLRPRKPRRV